MLCYDSWLFVFLSKPSKEARLPPFVKKVNKYQTPAPLLADVICAQALNSVQRSVSRMAYHVWCPQNYLDRPRLSLGSCAAQENQFLPQISLPMAWIKSRLEIRHRRMSYQALNFKETSYANRKIKDVIICLTQIFVLHPTPPHQ